MYKISDYIYEVYKEKSFTTAAKKLFISQPALSASIKKAENELGIVIFDRTSTPIKPTEAGALYIEMIEKTKEIEESFKNRIIETNNLTVGNITVGCANFITSCVLPDILQEFMKKYPGITISHIESNSEDLKEKLLTGVIDIVIDYDFDTVFFEQRLLKSETIYLCCSKSRKTVPELAKYALTGKDILRNDLGKVPYLDMSLIKDENFILLKKGNDMEHRAMSILKENGIRPNIPLQLDQVMTCYNISLKGLGMTFVTDTMVKASDNDDGLYFKIKSEFAKRDIYIAHKKHCILRNSVLKFIDMAQQTIKG